MSPIEIETTDTLTKMPSTINQIVKDQTRRPRFIITGIALTEQETKSRSPMRLDVVSRSVSSPLAAFTYREDTQGEGASLELCKITVNTGQKDF